VTISGTFPAAEKVEVQLKPTELAQSAGQGGSRASGEAPQPVTPEHVAWAVPQSQVSFVIPFDAPLGMYRILISFTQKGTTYGPFPVPVMPDGMLRIITKNPVKIEAVYPPVSYPVKDRFSFKVLGEGFSPLPEDNVLVIEGRDRDVLPACRGQEPGGNCVNLVVSDDARELHFSNIPPSDFKGPLQIQVRVGDQYSQKKDITLARVEKKYPAGIAVAIVLTLASLIFWILRRRRRAVTGGKSPGILSAIFLDTETNTYSLSKFQFYMWTAAALFGYIYLTVSKSWVQGDFTFADIPGNLPGIIFISASTTVLAVGITSSKGSKGAGELHPSLADLVSSGGVIAAERLQFFVWTIIGVFAFIFLTLSIEPATIRNLPTVPEGFLYLMGVSSFGYLGGKLARKPGPVISKMEAETAEGILMLNIHGSNLSPDANFRIDDADVPPNLLRDEDHSDGRPQVVTGDNQVGFAKVLRLILRTDNPVTQKWLTGTHLFTLTNPDGQKAAWNFSPTPAQTTLPPEETGETDETAKTKETDKPDEIVKTEETGKPDQPPPPDAKPAEQPTEKPNEPTPAPPPLAAPQEGAPQPPQPGVPTITDVSPASGSVNGGTPVVISGTGFAPTASVSFGETQAVTVTVLSSTAIIAQSPARSVGTALVSVQNPGGGSATFATLYRYVEEAAGGQ
jgi:hypothetical protein